jgi:acyl-CoA reductase-like NAD-dependent aldehyde dehydrogenase
MQRSAQEVAEVLARLAEEALAEEDSLAEALAAVGNS